MGRKDTLSTEYLSDNARFADMLEENVTLIERIYDAARMCAPDYDVDKIYAILQQ